MTLLLGADAGGTKIELLAEAPSGERLDLFGPACNLQRIGHAAAADVLGTLVRDATDRLPGARRVVLAAGLAGAGHAPDRDRLAALVRERFSDAPFALDVTVTHDADIALEGAFGTGSGFIVIAGTGSVVMARTHDGALHRTGGWGYLLGDEGSGYAVGLAALRRLAAALDGARPASVLTRLLQERLALPDAAALIRHVYREQQPLQRAAPLVCEACRAGDAEAGALLDGHADALAAQVGLLARTLGPDVDPRVALLGGVTKEDVYQTRLVACILTAVQADGRTWTVASIPRSPAEGALAMARRLASAAA